MKVRIALAGEMIANQKLFNKVDVLLGQITGFLCRDIENSEV